MDPYIGEIRCFGFNFAPRGWLACEGQLMSISQNSALFSLLGTMYGGDGATTFALPDLRGRASLGAGAAPGLTPRNEGDAGGAEVVTLTAPALPPHSHTVAASSSASTKNPSGATPAVTGAGASYGTTDDLIMDPAMIGGGGDAQPHDNMQPYLVLNWCIAIDGAFPPRD
ncbi:phage tail protein [Microbacterium sp. ZW T2_14]|uniref:phage tail protein n=1 Tax=Microbacterium sp. ZW T2_14 TaxID=3378079 RepID=UPI0038549408